MTVAERAMRSKFFALSSIGGGSVCWKWQGSKGHGGHGHIYRPINIYAHRAAYEIAHGRKLVRGEIIHHVCENPGCVNPAHLTITSREEHPRIHRPTHCVRGHEFTPENTIERSDGARSCRICVNAAKRERYATDPEYRQRKIDGRAERRRRGAK